MKHAEVIVRWQEGLHARPASLLVRIANKFGSTINLIYDGKVADARSIMSIMLLCATMGALLEVEAQGEDEDQALEAIERVFSRDV